MIKVGENFEILRAYNGYHRLTDEEIRLIYGNNPKISGLDKKNFQSEDFYFYSDCFYSEILLIVTRVAELKRRSSCPKLDNITCRELIKDIFEAGEVSFRCMHNNDCRREGLFMPYFSCRPHKYLNKVPYEFKEALLSLKKQGKVIALITNSHYGLFNVVFPYTFGEVKKNIIFFRIMLSILISLD